MTILALRHDAWRRPFVVLAATLLALILAAQPARGAETQGPDEARQFLQTFGQRAVGMLADTSLSESQRESAFRALIRAGFEIDTIGKLVLGRHWKTASESQRREFSALFEDYVVFTTLERLSGYTGQVLEVGAARLTQNNKLVTVSSRIARGSGPAIRLDWRIRRTHRDWRIIDVVIEGVSMLQTHRAEFDAVIRNNGKGLDGLLQRLRTIVAA